MAHSSTHARSMVPISCISICSPKCETHALDLIKTMLCHLMATQHGFGAFCL